MLKDEFWQHHCSPSSRNKKELRPCVQNHVCRRAGQVNRNRCSNVSFTETIFGLGIRDQKWFREVMNLCRFWRPNCSLPETIFGLGIRDQKWFREVMNLCRFWRPNCSIPETIFGLGIRDQKWFRELCPQGFPY